MGLAVGSLLVCILSSLRAHRRGGYNVMQYSLCTDMAGNSLVLNFQNKTKPVSFTSCGHGLHKN